MKPHVYRNRADYEPPVQHWCQPCYGWYGVPHTGNHCQQRMPGKQPDQCACRYCREAVGRPVEGDYGYFTNPPPPV